MRIRSLIARLALTILTGVYSGIGLAEPELLEAPSVALAPAVPAGATHDRIRFLGMLQLPDIRRNGTRLSQLSGLAWDDDEGVLYAVSDRGFLFHLVPEFDGDVLVRLRLKKAVVLNDPLNNTSTKRKYVDTEGLDILNGRNGKKGDAVLVVSYERIPTIARFSPDGRVLGKVPLPAVLNDVKKYQSSNKMLESVCVDPSLGTMTTPELPLMDEFNDFTRIFSVAGQEWLYPLESGERITALECLGHGDVLVLQQRYTQILNRIVVWLKRVTLKAGARERPLSPVTVATWDNRDGLQIDNFEGLARHRGRRFFMVSDNNDLFIQRTLLMYFELPDEAGVPGGKRRAP